MLDWQQLGQLNNERHQMLLAEATSRRMSIFARNKMPEAAMPNQMYKWLGRRLIILACRVQAIAHVHLTSIERYRSGT